MSDTFHYLGFDVQEIQNKKFICIYVLDIEKKVIFKLFKVYNEVLIEYLGNNFETFDDITTHLSFVIKRNGKVTLDIKFK